APQPGTGKSTLARLGALISTGIEPITTDLPINEQRFTDQLVSVLMTKPEAILLDNLDPSRTFKSSTLAGAITSEQWTSRVLTKPDIVTIPMRTTICISGNNPSLHEELDARSVRIRILSNAERQDQHADFYLTR